MEPNMVVAFSEEMSQGAGRRAAASLSSTVVLACNLQILGSVLVSLREGYTP